MANLERKVFCRGQTAMVIFLRLVTVYYYYIMHYQAIHPEEKQQYIRFDDKNALGNVGKRQIG